MSEWFEWRDAPRADFAVIGDPISHSYSPIFQQAGLDAAGLGRRYVAIRVPADEFGNALEHLIELGYAGLNVTVPLKEIAFQWCARVEGEAEILKAVNTIRLADRVGINTDAPGFAQSLFHLKPGPPGKALVLGAGGAARAVIYALNQLGWEISVFNRTVSRIDEIARDLNLDLKVQERASAEGFPLIVNATTGSKTWSIEVDFENAESDLLFYDLMAGNSLSYQVAKQAGVRAVEGSGMLLEQGILAFEVWNGIPAPREAMRAALEAAIENS